MTKVNSVGVSLDDNSGFPVCLQNAAKSFTEPGSVATTFNTWPDSRSASAFLARRIGNGQFSPLTSSSRWYWVVVMFYERCFGGDAIRILPFQTDGAGGRDFKCCPAIKAHRMRGPYCIDRGNRLTFVHGIADSRCLCRFPYWFPMWKQDGVPSKRCVFSILRTIPWTPTTHLHPPFPFHMYFPHSVHHARHC